MDIIATRDFSTTTHGNISGGDRFTVGKDISEGFARHMVEHGLGEIEQEYQTKVVRDIPSDAGVEKPSSSSLAARPSPKKTPKRSAGKGGSSRST